MTQSSRRVVERANRPATRDWVALGDSFTAGHMSGERTWVDAVYERLAAAGEPPRLLNLAAKGATVAEVEREQVGLAIAADPGLVTVICGGNDVIGTVRPDVGAFGAAFDRIARRLRDGLPVARVLTATYPEVAPTTLRERSQRRVLDGLVALNAAIRAVAGRRELALIDFAAHPDRQDAANVAADGVHPSPEGHRKAALMLAPAIEGLLA